MRKWFLVFCLIYPLATTAEKDEELAITHVIVIDCTGAAPEPNSTVIIGNGHIRVVGPSDRVRIAAGVRVIDGSGKFLIPGLWDMHGHLTDATEDAFPLLIMNGVTGVRDMGGDLAQINRWLQTALIEAAKLAPRWNPQLAVLHARELERGHRNRATLAVARKLAAYLLAVDKSGQSFQIRLIPSLTETADAPTTTS
jgi:hypothetical protein